jgi:hypothetical protein
MFHYKRKARSHVILDVYCAVNDSVDNRFVGQHVPVLDNASMCVEDILNIFYSKQI